MTFADAEKKLRFKFKKRPLIIGGHAMEFYGLRKAGEDFDLVLHKSDHSRLKKFLDKQGMKYIKENLSKYKNVPTFVDLCGDQGILFHEFEMWNNIVGFDYDHLSKDAKKKGKYLIISLERLLFLKALAMLKPKYLKDLKLIVKKIIKDKYETK